MKFKNLKFKKRNKRKSLKRELLEKKINLLPDRVRKQKMNRRKALAAFAVFGIAGALLFSYTFKMKLETDRLRNENQLISAKIQTLHEEQTSQDLIQYLEEKIRYKQELLLRLKFSNKSVYNTLQYIDSSLPEGVNYLSVAVSNGNVVSINGTAQSFEQVADFLYNLKQIKQINSAFLSNTSKQIVKDGKSGMEFEICNYSITCQLGGSADEA